MFLFALQKAVQVSTTLNIYDSLTTDFTLFLALLSYQIIWKHIFDTIDIYQISSCPLVLLQHAE